MKKTSWGEPTFDITKITPTRLRRLLQLCHPDRHDNSPLSNEMFHWLMDVSQELDKRKKRV